MILFNASINELFFLLIHKSTKPVAKIRVSTKPINNVISRLIENKPWSNQTKDLLAPL